MKNTRIAVIVLFSVVTVLAIVLTSSAQQTPTPAPPPPPPPARVPGVKLQGGDPLDDFKHPKNLKVLPKNITPQNLQATMRLYSRSLGVRCGFCHADKPAKAGERPERDFASDTKPEKRNARKMILMTADINKKYLQKMEKGFETITCVSCHHGSAKPMVSVDSLPPVKK